MIDRVKPVAVLLALVFACVACGKHGPAEEESTGATAVPDVTVAKVERGTLVVGLTVSGNLAALPNNDSKVAALVPGRVSRVMVTEGDRVSAGQEVAELDSSLLRDQQHQAEAAVAQAQANVENARLALQREQSLLQRGISSQKEVEDARTQLAVNEGALKTAEAGLTSARAQVGRAVIRAPFAGTVVHRFVSAGEQVDGTAAQPVVEIANVDTLELMGTIPAARLREIAPGTDFTIQTNAVPGATFAAKLIAILPAVDPATNNGTVRIRIVNRQHLLKLGQFLSIELPLKQAGPRLLVPRQAIYPNEAGEPHVYRVSGDEAQSVPVELGAQTKEKAEILSGVQEGDTVIVTGGYGLPEKAKVHVTR